MIDYNNFEKYSMGEEIANSITHGVGALFSIVALVLMVIYSAIYGSAVHVFSSTLFGVSLIILYTFSTLYHAITHKKAKLVLEIMDHSAIYFLIAGTYTPFTLITLRDSIGINLFIIIWSMAIIGAVLKVFLVKKFMIISTLIYIFMGWLVIFGFRHITEALSSQGLFWLILGGVLYTVGTIFYMWRKIKFHHMIWHLFVLSGSFAHFFAVFFHVIPR